MRMHGKHTTRWTYDAQRGQGRVCVAIDGSSIQFEVRPKTAFMIWSPTLPAVRAFQAIVELTLDLEMAGTGLLIRGYARKLIEIDDWRKIWPLLPAITESEVQFVRFDFPTRAVSTSPLIHGRSGRHGVAMILRQDADQPGSYDIATLRQAFEATAHDSIRGEFDWMLETLSL